MNDERLLFSFPVGVLYLLLMFWFILSGVVAQPDVVSVNSAHRGRYLLAKGTEFGNDGRRLINSFLLQIHLTVDALHHRHDLLGSLFNQVGAVGSFDNSCV